jgi:RNA polymerase sigma factor (sigma-70 family)
MPVFKLSASNLTPAGVGSSYSDADWVRAIRHGIGPDGKPLLFLAGQIPLIPAELIDHDAPRPAEPPPGETVAYGEYLAVGCTGCHGPGFSGGTIPGVPPEWPEASNITPDQETGIGSWNRVDFLRAMKECRRPDGDSRLILHMSFPVTLPLASVYQYCVTTQGEHMTSAEQVRNPFRPEDEGDPTDGDLVADAVEGDQGALEILVARHQRWIYNLAFRMIMVPEDAEDVTQEVLVKVLTKLGSYDAEKGAFRTWLYRVVTNHVLNMKARGYEEAITGFDSYYSFVDQVPNQEPDDTPETALIAEDLKIGCVMGTLLCLDRTQRLAFILAVAFGATDSVGSELLGTSPDAFRKTLSRARVKLRKYMGGNCGLVNPEAPCRCRKKVKSFVDSGAYTVDRLNYLVPDRPAMEEIVGRVGERYKEEVDSRFQELFRSHPFYSGKDMIPWLREILADPGFERVFTLN